MTTEIAKEVLRNFALLLTFENLQRSTQVTWCHPNIALGGLAQPLLSSQKHLHKSVF